LRIFELKKSQISELSAILDFGGYACDIISRVHAIILSIEQLVIMSPKSYTSVTV
jgi:hypothetical protein